MRNTVVDILIIMLLSCIVVQMVYAIKKARRIEKMYKGLEERERKVIYIPATEVERPVVNDPSKQIQSQNSISVENFFNAHLSTGTEQFLA